MATNDNIPQWKKDLILRKRLTAGNGASHRDRASSVSTTVSVGSSTSARCDGVPTRCESVPSRCESVPTNPSASACSDSHKMVQDSVLVMRMITTNGDCCRSEATQSDSDSSEELQYGPGIVSKLKSKYLSLTLRETHTAAPRPSILPLRRAASLEDLLDADDDKPVVNNRRFTPRIPAAGAITAPSPRYRAMTRRAPNESVKRARSVETITRSSDIAPLQPSAPIVVPGARKPCRPLRIAPVLDKTERPPADHVKQTLRLFEGPASKRTKPPAPTGDVAAKVASFKQIIQQNIPPAPPLSPKPTVLPPKPTNIPPPNSPIKTNPLGSPVKLVKPLPIPVEVTKPMKPLPIAPEPSPIPDVLDAAAGSCTTPDLIVHSSPRPFSPRALHDVTQTFLNSEISHTQQTFSTKPTSSVTSRPKSPQTVTSRSPSPRIPQSDPPPKDSKEITRQAVDNISKAGHTITYRFSDISPKSQSHLPRLNSIPVRIKLVPDTSLSSPPLKLAPPIPVTPTKKPANVVNGSAMAMRPSVQPPKAPLTSREIEKNSINKLKTLEQPVSKVVVAMKSVDEVVAKKAKPRSQQQETTILFNFSARETIPDYIATDGSEKTRRGKREKPKPGESGIILLPGAPAEEFADDDEDWLLSLNGPPSPCDVHFVNDNILIDGRSSISKQPKRQKMRIQFDDDATQVFEYLSEASALEDTAPVTPPVTSPPPVAGHTVPSLTGSSFSSYTPSKMSLTSDFQLGVTRHATPVVTAPVACAPDSLDLLAVGPPDHPVTYSAETTADILF